jgi:hypothetical protein
MKIFVVEIAYSIQYTICIQYTIFVQYTICIQYTICMQYTNCIQYTVYNSVPSTFAVPVTSSYCVFHKKLIKFFGMLTFKRISRGFTDVINRVYTGIRDNSTRTNSLILNPYVSTVVLYFHH